MPCALNRSVSQDVAQRHCKFLVSARVGYGRDSARMSNETYRLASRSHDAESSLVGYFFDSRDSLERGIIHKSPLPATRYPLLASAIRSAQSAVVVAIPDKFT